MTNNQECITNLREKLTEAHKALEKLIIEPRKNTLFSIDTDIYEYERHQTGLKPDPGDQKQVHYVIVCNSTQVEQVVLKEFLKNVAKTGVKIEIDTGIVEFVHPDLHFIKLFIPTDVVEKYANIYGINLHCHHQNPYRPSRRVFWKRMDIPELNLNSQANIHHRIPDLFEKERLPTDVEKIMVIYKILRITYYDMHLKDYGVESLKYKKLIVAHYPVHDGTYQWSKKDGYLGYRQVLHEYWSRMYRWCRVQPLDAIERYFGAEIAIYFAWFGFYINMLLWSSVIGVVFFLLGVVFFWSNKVYIDELCESDSYICPSCPEGHQEKCPYATLNVFCSYSKLSYFFDNFSTVVFAIFMSFWATLYYELWKRKEAKLKLKWNLMVVETDYTPRVEFGLQTSRRRISKVTGELEPYVPLIVKVYKYSFTAIFVVMMILLIVFMILLVILYNVMLTKTIRTMNNKLLNQHAPLIASVTSAIITVTMIKVIALIYSKVALYLTDKEMHRTQVEYENAYIYKLYAMAFVNYYFPVIYIAFIKDRLYTHPKDNYNAGLFTDLRSDVCPPTGCLLTLTIHLIFILVVKEVSFKIFTYLVMIIRAGVKNRKAKHAPKNVPQWEKDFELLPVSTTHLITDYMEIVLQYGLVLFFVAACPICPLITLIYNIVELRLDARKFTRYFRRPVPRRLPGLGAWNGIIQTVTILSTVFNGFVIAFTSDIVPREYFRFTNQNSLSGFINSTFSISSFKERSEVKCFYRGHRYPDGHEKQYSLTEFHWVELALRLTFVVIFEHVILGLAGIFAYAIPDVPFSVKAQLSYEKEKTKTRQSNI